MKPLSVTAGLDATPPREHAFFLDPDQRIFVTHHRAAGAAYVVIAPPLFEELARTRKLLVNVARDLAASGFDAVRFDYPGTGLSTVSSEELTPSAAFEALRRVVAYCRELGAPRIDLLGFRFGGYLALSLARELAGARVILWEPVLDLADHFHDLLRAELGNQVVTYGKVRRGRDPLTAALRSGEAVVIDGNRISAACYREIESAAPLDLAGIAAAGTRAVVMCWDDDKLAAAARHHEIATVVVEGVKFSYKHIRTLEPRSPALFRATLDAVKGT